VLESQQYNLPFKKEKIISRKSEETVVKTSTKMGRGIRWAPLQNFFHFFSDNLLKDSDMTLELAEIGKIS
jgi:hypothetical protein